VGELEHLLDGAARFLHGQLYETTVIERRVVAPGDE
jgi:hypothetical protein